MMGAAVRNSSSNTIRVAVPRSNFFPFGKKKIKNRRDLIGNQQKKCRRSSCRTDRVMAITQRPAIICSIVVVVVKVSRSREFRSRAISRENKKNTHKNSPA
jgi:hypothetical protein